RSQKLPTEHTRQEDCIALFIPSTQALGSFALCNRSNKNKKLKQQRKLQVSNPYQYTAKKDNATT
ncbi:MAG TPA: hypothetical protein PKJ53_00005, partial [Spirochaetales bacterium]|nr:hypothetical protein [Spirochaetales bacterium]